MTRYNFSARAYESGRVSKETYDGERARRYLARFLAERAEHMLIEVQHARQQELSFAPNASVDVAEFDNLKIKLQEVLSAATKLLNDNDIE